MAKAIKKSDEALMVEKHIENLRNGLNAHTGKITHKEVAEELGYDHIDSISALNS